MCVCTMAEVSPASPATRLCHPVKKKVLLRQHRVQRVVRGRVPKQQQVPVQCSVCSCCLEESSSTCSTKCANEWTVHITSWLCLSSGILSLSLTSSASQLSKLNSRKPPVCFLVVSPRFSWGYHNTAGQLLATNNFVLYSSICNDFIHEFPQSG